MMNICGTNKMVTLGTLASYTFLSPDLFSASLCSYQMPEGSFCLSLCFAAVLGNSPDAEMAEIQRSPVGEAT